MILAWLRDVFARRPADADLERSQKQRAQLASRVDTVTASVRRTHKTIADDYRRFEEAIQRHAAASRHT